MFYGRAGGTSHHAAAARAQGGLRDEGGAPHDVDSRVNGSRGEKG